MITRFIFMKNIQQYSFSNRQKYRHISSPMQKIIALCFISVLSACTLTDVDAAQAHSAKTVAKKKAIPKSTPLLATKKISYVAPDNIDTPIRDSLFLQTGDRVVWLGDSITAAHTYTRYVETFFLLRRPDLNLTFINAGIGGHSSWDGLGRLDRDVLAYNPSVVVINFGMNDAGYPENSVHAALLKNLDTMFVRLRAGGVKRIVLIDPSPTDTVTPGVPAGNKLLTRQANLEQYVAAIQARSPESDVVVVHWQDPLKQALYSLAANPEYRLIPDRIHPNMLGHAVMALQILRGIGADTSGAAIESQYQDGKIMSTYKVAGSSSSKPIQTETKLSSHLASLDISNLLPPIPYIVKKSEADMLANSDLNQLASLQWTIRGLDDDNRYRVLLGSKEIGIYTASELANGVNLMSGLERNNKSFIEKLPTQEACSTNSEIYFFSDFDCLSSMVYKKDQLRLATRTDKNVTFPDFMTDQYASYQALMQSWLGNVDQAIKKNAKEIRQRSHTLTIEFVKK